MSERKSDHLNLARKVQLPTDLKVAGANYEPMFSSLSQVEHTDISLKFLGKTMLAPLWISSMTGGTGKAAHINRNLAQACRDFGLGMGLGSCRVLLDSEKYFEDFNLRSIIGEQLPFFANFGIAQIEQALEEGSLTEVLALVEQLKCDGLIVHINPLQEWFQPEGDRYKKAPLETIQTLLDEVKLPVIVKEVGQGFGPKSLGALLQLPLAAIDFGAFGGTNFTLLEMMRSQDEKLGGSESMAHIGHSAEEMVEMVNELTSALDDRLKCREIIISGGIKSYLHGYKLCQRTILNCVYGQAKNFLEYATGDYEKLREYTANQVTGIKLAKNFIDIVE